MKRAILIALVLFFAPKGKKRVLRNLEYVKIIFQETPQVDNTTYGNTR